MRLPAGPPDLPHGRARLHISNPARSARLPVATAASKTPPVASDNTALRQAARQADWRTAPGRLRAAARRHALQRIRTVVPQPSAGRAGCETLGAAVERGEDAVGIDRCQTGLRKIPRRCAPRAHASQPVAPAARSRRAGAMAQTGQAPYRCRCWPSPSVCRCRRALFRARAAALGHGRNPGQRPLRVPAQLGFRRGRPRNDRSSAHSNAISARRRR